ncbi:MAG: hypothetical protein U0900_02150 [Myxococcota bacterium]
MGCIFLVLTTTIPGLAFAAGETTMHEVVWAHPDPVAVKRFLVFVSGVKGDQAGARRIDVGKPESQPSGTVQVFSAIVPIATEEFVAVAAVGYDGRTGTLSSWSSVPPTRPGQPIVIEP